MTQEEFDTLKVNDIISNKKDLGEIKIGYDYKVIVKTPDKIVVSLLQEEHDGSEYVITRDNVESCLDLYKL